MTEPDFDPDLDLDTLIRNAWSYADHILRRDTQLFPFGLGMAPDGSLQLAQMTSLDPATSAPQLVELLWSRYRDEAAARKIIACAVSYDANVGEGRGRRDAIAVSVEDRSGAPFTSFLPYRKRRFRGIDYDHKGRFRQHSERRVFLDRSQVTSADA